MNSDNSTLEILSLPTGRQDICSPQIGVCKFPFSTYSQTGREVAEQNRVSAEIFLAELNK